MEKHLNVLSQALNKANQQGAFTLQESAMISQSLSAIVQSVANQVKSKSLEEVRAEARESRDKNTPVEELPVTGAEEVKG